MRSIATPVLLNELLTMVGDHQARVETILPLPIDLLNSKPAPDAWSALECIEHLNLVNHKYIPVIDEKLAKEASSPSPIFRSTIFGQFFVKRMLPGPQMKKIKTLSMFVPSKSMLDRDVIEHYLADQERLRRQLTQAELIDMNHVRIPLSITKWVTIRLGDAFRTVIYHDLRHILQAERALNDAQ